MYYSKITPNQKQLPVFASEIAHSFTISSLNIFVPEIPKNETYTIDEFCNKMFRSAAKPSGHKTNSQAILPVSFKSDAPSIHQEYIETREVLFLDIDNGDPQYHTTHADIHNDLRGFVHFIWTTNSHNPSEGRFKYRVMIPLAEKILPGPWKNDITKRLMQRFENLGIDPSCLRISQAAFEPLAHPYHPQVEFWWSYGKVFSINDLPKFTDQSVKKYASTSIDTEHACTLAQIVTHALSQNSRLHSRDRAFRFGMACSIIAAFGQSTGQIVFSDLDMFMRKPHTNSPTVKVWSDALKNTNNTPDLLLGSLPRHLVRLLGCNRIIPIIDPNPYTGAEYLSWEWIQAGTWTDLILRASMGSGKNHTMESAIRSGKKVIMFVPNTTHRMQAGSGNKFECTKLNGKWEVIGDKILVWNQAPKVMQAILEGKINPREWTIVVDEVHCLLTERYRAAVIMDLVNLFQCRWKQRIVMSATIEPDSAVNSLFSKPPLFKRYDRVIPGNTTEYTVVEGVATNKAIIETIKHCREAVNHGPVLAIHNNKRHLETIKDELVDSGLSVAIIHADNQSDETTIANEVITTNEYDTKGEIDVFLATNIMCEGINLCDDIDAAGVVIADHLPITKVYQTMGRWRKAKHRKLFHIFNKDRGSDLRGIEMLRIADSLHRHLFNGYKNMVKKTGEATFESLNAITAVLSGNNDVHSELASAGVNYNHGTGAYTTNPAQALFIEQAAYDEWTYESMGNLLSAAIGVGFTDGNIITMDSIGVKQSTGDIISSARVVDTRRSNRLARQAKIKNVMDRVTSMESIDKICVNDLDIDIQNAFDIALEYAHNLSKPKFMSLMDRALRGTLTMDGVKSMKSAGNLVGSIQNTIKVQFSNRDLKKEDLNKMCSMVIEHVKEICGFTTIAQVRKEFYDVFGKWKDVVEGPNGIACNFKYPSQKLTHLIGLDKRYVTINGTRTWVYNVAQ